MFDTGLLARFAPNVARRVGKWLGQWPELLERLNSLPEEGTQERADLEHAADANYDGVADALRDVLAQRAPRQPFSLTAKDVRQIALRQSLNPNRSPEDLLSEFVAQRGA